jgi:hypothetical protein
MHPTQKKTITPLSQSRSDRKLGHVPNRHSGRETQSTRIAASPSHRNRSSHKNARSKERRSDKGSAMQNIQKVLSLARTLKSKDWISAMKKETDRHAVVHLHDTLETVLAMSNQTYRED